MSDELIEKLFLASENERDALIQSVALAQAENARLREINAAQAAEIARLTEELKSHEHMQLAIADACAFGTGWARVQHVGLADVLLPGDEGAIEHAKGERE